MNRYFRILVAAALAAGLAGPFSMAAVLAQTQAAAPATQSTGSIAGSIHDSSGAPISNATVTLSGAANLKTTTDAKGAFSFPGVAPGIYSFTAAKPGYTTASEASVIVLAGQTQTLSVVMNTITFSSLRTIAAVRSTGRGTYNTTPASVSVVSSQTFQDQAQPQVMKVLNETPGVVASLPQSSANGTAPGAITFPNIRGALSFETASLIDGHPVSVGSYGDYVTTFLNPFMLKSIELVKGPGADAPEVNYAIGGTVNFQTKDPSYTTSGMLQVGTDNWGSTILNFGLSDTVGRLGYVFAYGSNDLQSNISNTATWVSPQSPQQGILNFNGTTGTAVGYNDIYPTPTVPGTISTRTNTYYLAACCERVGSDLYQNQSELAKLRYRLSPVTYATFTYLGSQTYTNQTANTGDVTPSTFTLNGSGASAGQIASYNGSLPAGSALDVGYVRTPEHEINNEPILEGDLRTTLGNDTVLARYYSAGIHRLLYQGSNSPYVPTVLNMRLYGYDSATKQVYNGQPQSVAFFDYYNQAENDALKGYSFEYNHPFASGNDLLTFSYDGTHSTTTSYSVGAGGPSAGRTFNIADVYQTEGITLPTGSAQTFGTAMLRGFFHLRPNLTMTFSNYFNTYRSTYPTKCNLKDNACTFDGSGFSFATATSTHYDPRIAFEFRPNSNVALRFSAGSAIAPPYLALLSQVPQPIAYNKQLGFATQKVNGGTIEPETSFGYDLGADYRFKDNATFAGIDLYESTLYNHFLTTYGDSGGPCPATDPITGKPTPSGCAGAPLFYQFNTNLANARFQGVELSIKRVPLAGLGFVVQGALQRGYAYNLPAYFYCSNPGPGCTPNTNLGIIPGQNFTGGGINGTYPSAPYAAISANALSNQNVPYAQGYGELNYRTAHGWYGNVNLTYYGKNNSLDEPPFTVLGATVRAPLGNGISLQISGDNLTNKYSGVWPVYGTGVPVPLANGYSAATQANVLFPRTFRFLFTKAFGEGAPPNP